MSLSLSRKKENFRFKLRLSDKTKRAQSKISAEWGYILSAMFFPYFRPYPFLPWLFGFVQLQTMGSAPLG